MDDAVRIHSLTTRFVLTLLLSAAVPLLLFGWFVRGEMQQRLEKQVVNVLLKGHATLIADRVDTLLDQIYWDCAFVETDAQEALAGGVSESQFRNKLDRTPGFNTHFQLAMLADSEGRVLHTFESLGLNTMRQAERHALDPQSVADQVWFRAIADSDQGLFWQDRHVSPFLHRNPDKHTLDPSQYSLGLAFRIDSTDGAWGVFYALVKWERIQDIVDDVAGRLKVDAGFDRAETVLTDCDGLVLASSQRALYRGPLEPGALRHAVITAREPHVAHYDDLDGEHSLVGTAPIEQRVFDWHCAVVAPARQLFQTSYEFARSLLIAIAVIAAILVAWSLYASRRILRPVRTLSGATRQVAQGDLSARVPVRGKDELAELGRAFNRMAEDIAQSREQLRVSERTAAWAEMARQVAHEIKNPLTPMRMSAQLLQKARRENDPRLPHLVDRLSRSVIAQTEQLARIASDFRHFAGHPERQVEVLAADGVLDDVDRDFAAFVEADDSNVDLRAGAPGTWVRADRIELRRVFMNLVQNALHACGDGGRVVVASWVDGDEVVFSVRDDGPGIPEDVAAHLFEPYFTTRSSGTGLGLAICKRLIEAQGGSIELYSSEPGATEFRLRLPTCPAPPAAEP